MGNKASSGGGGDKVANAWALVSEEPGATLSCKSMKISERHMVQHFLVNQGATFSCKSMKISERHTVQFTIQFEGPIFIKSKD